MALRFLVTLPESTLATRREQEIGNLRFLRTQVGHLGGTVDLVEEEIEDVDE